MEVFLDLPGEDIGLHDILGRAVAAALDELDDRRDGLEADQFTVLHLIAPCS